MLRILLGMSTLVVLVALVILIIGHFSPVDYKGELSEFFIDRRPIIWQALTNIETIPGSKGDVTNIEILSNDRGIVTWTEHLYNGGYRTYRIVEKREPYQYTINLFDSSNKITGKWTFFLKNSNNGSVVTISEESRTENVWLRGRDAILGRDVNLKREMKNLRVALFRRLINTP